MARADAEACPGRGLQVTSAPRALPPRQEALGESPWSGMSGAAVLAGERLIGVVSEHAPRRGESTITAAGQPAVRQHGQRVHRAEVAAELGWACPGEPVPDLLAGRGVDRGSAVIAGELVLGGYVPVPAGPIGR